MRMSGEALTATSTHHAPTVTTTAGQDTKDEDGSRGRHPQPDDDKCTDEDVTTQ